MTNERWREVERLFHECRAKRPPERTAWLNDACAGDAALYFEVLSLLVANPAEDWMTRPPARLAADLIAREQPVLGPGRTIGDYTILSSISAGGMGEVYLAEHSGTQTRVAVKVLHRHLTLDPQAVERFSLEARAAAAVTHPNLVAVLGAGEAEAGHYLAMEWVDGRTWRTLIDNGSTGPGTAVRLGAQAARGLEAAHRAGILHRDIKPENLMVRDDGVVKILDFGLARFETGPRFDPELLGSSGTISGTLSGTLLYMPPELFRGELATSASDVFSLAVVLYELASGVHPFAGETPLDVFEAIECRVVPPPSKFRSDIPGTLDGILTRMLARDRSERPEAAEAAAVLEELQATVRGSEPSPT